MKIITHNLLRSFDGDHELEIHIANNGIVYDVTDCPKWKTGLHENLHFGGQDLSQELTEAPHTDIVFNHPCVKIIGVLEKANNE